MSRSDANVPELFEYVSGLMGECTQAEQMDALANVLALIAIAGKPDNVTLAEAKAYTVEIVRRHLHETGDLVRERFGVT